MTKYNKTMWIGLLEQNEKDEIENYLYDSLKHEGIYAEDEMDFIIRDGMDCRLCDLEEVIDLNELTLIEVI